MTLAVGTLKAVVVPGPGPTVTVTTLAAAPELELLELELLLELLELEVPELELLLELLLVELPEPELLEPAPPHAVSANSTSGRSSQRECRIMQYPACAVGGSPIYRSSDRSNPTGTRLGT